MNRKRKKHRWSGAGYLCADCGAIKDTCTETRYCSGEDPPPSKRQPKGLAEFEGTLADLKWCPELLKRLMDLPEHGFHREMVAFEDAMKVAENAEIAAQNCREAARRIARRIWENAKKNWTVKELQDATGYDDE